MKEYDEDFCLKIKIQLEIFRKTDMLRGENFEYPISQLPLLMKL